MPDKVRLGVVGTSWWAENILLPAVQSHSRAELRAVCGRNRERAEGMAAKFHGQRVFTDYREMFASGGLDAMIIAAPDDQHHAMALAAIDAGLHVLCEKPLALNAGQAWEMYQAALAAGVQHMVMFTYRWMPFFRYARDMLAEGVIGRCYHGEFRYLSGFARGSDYSWRQDARRGNGILGDLGSHAIDLARWLVGDIARVSADLRAHVDRPGPDGAPMALANDSALVLLGFENGAQGTLQASGVAHLADRVMQQHVRLYGQDGTLEIDVPYWGAEAGAVIRAARSQDEQFRTLEVPDSYWGDASRLEPFDVLMKHSAGVRLFVDAIVEGRPATPSFYDGFKAQQVIDAALESSRSGLAVRIEEPAG